MKHIILDPGHGGTLGKDNFRQGLASEREEWINLSVAKQLKPLLEAQGFIVTLTRRKDVEVSLETRVNLAITSKADLFVSIHHASCDPVIRDINFPFFYTQTSQNTDQQVVLINSFLKEFMKLSHGPGIAYSDQWVFDEGLFVLRECEAKGIPSILTEYSFFSHPEEEKRLKTKEYCYEEAKVLKDCIVSYFENLKSRTPSSKSAIKKIEFPAPYLEQLRTIKKSLIENRQVDWLSYLQQAELFLSKNDHTQALVNYEKALALNPYHSDIESHLNKMFLCTNKLRAEEYKNNINALLDNITTLSL